MNLDRTTIIPLDDAALAKTLFQTFLDLKMVVGMIVMGDGPRERDLVEKANNLAHVTYMNVERRVLWVRDYNILKKELVALIEKTAYGTLPFEEIKILTLSPIFDKVSDVLKESDRIDYPRLHLSFINAQNGELMRLMGNPFS